MKKILEYIWKKSLNIYETKILEYIWKKFLNICETKFLNIYIKKILEYKFSFWSWPKKIQDSRDLESDDVIHIRHHGRRKWFLVWPMILNDIMTGRLWIKVPSV